jgi:DNA ligase (NAD+)
MNRILELESLIRYHKALYYQGRPEIHDHEYDSLEEELRGLDPENAILQMVGSAQISGKKVKHDSKMLSLNKTYKADELLKWIENRDTVSTFKVDGVSCSLLYKDSEFVLGKTRGDGSVGEDITEKLRWISNVPMKLENRKKSGNLEIRGELYCDELSFFKLAEEMEAIGLERPKSQRNIVAGLMGRKENLELCRYLKFMAFDLMYDEHDERCKFEMEKLHELQEFHFEIPLAILHRNNNGVEERIVEAEAFMTSGEYLIDGLVFSYNDCETHEELGSTAHHPRYKMAFKYQGESKQTVLNDITWQVSRNGILTPIGEVEPVELSGAKISRVTLHNYGMVKQNNLKKGDLIEIIRSGEVIPKFLSVVKESTSDFEIPRNCPACNSLVEIEEIRLFCTNDECPAKIKEQILNFIKKIGIDDLSGRRLDELINKNLVKKISDLYRLEIDDFLKLDKTKEKLAQKLYKSIQGTKSTNLIVFLSALGIQGGAINKCEKVIEAGFDSIDKLKSMSVDSLMEVDSFAEKSSSEFVKSLGTKWELVDELINLGFEFEAIRAVESNALEGKKFCITGTLSMKRSEIEKIIKSNGGKIASSVSKNLDYLITNDTESSSSKFKKAKDLNIPILNEDALLVLLKN